MIGAIDPGANGALVILHSSDVFTFVDYKAKGIRGYIEALKDYPLQLLGIELVHSMPNQGVASTFSFGQRFGELIGIAEALDIPYELVQPRQWQKHLGLSKATKQEIADAILQIYPNAELLGKRKGLLDGRSDALGILHYIKEKL